MTPGGRPLLWLATGSLLLSCADIAAPSRSNAYEWRRIVGIDTLSFHWPKAELPVRFWVEDSLNLPAHVEHGIAEWEAAFLYGEFAGEVVSDSNKADFRSPGSSGDWPRNVREPRTSSFRLAGTRSCGQSGSTSTPVLRRARPA
ncbi:MAG: hypothetical protein K0S19_961 [Geminicoccaceae bacterium]|nr:hypothetical protein [Geminicoccaceae bacterium]